MPHDSHLQPKAVGTPTYREIVTNASCSASVCSAESKPASERKSSTMRLKRRNKYQRDTGRCQHAES